MGSYFSLKNFSQFFLYFISGERLNLEPEPSERIGFAISPIPIFFGHCPLFGRWLLQENSPFEIALVNFQVCISCLELPENCLYVLSEYRQNIHRYRPNREKLSLKIRIDPNHVAYTQRLFLYHVTLLQRNRCFDLFAPSVEKHKFSLNITVFPDVSVKLKKNIKMRPSNFILQ